MFKKANDFTGSERIPMTPDEVVTFFLMAACLCSMSLFSRAEFSTNCVCCQNTITLVVLFVFFKS